MRSEVGGGASATAESQTLVWFSNMAVVPLFIKVVLYNVEIYTSSTPISHTVNNVVQLIGERALNVTFICTYSLYTCISAKLVPVSVTSLVTFAWVKPKYPMIGGQ